MFVDEIFVFEIFVDCIDGIWFVFFYKDGFLLLFEWVEFIFGCCYLKKC